VNLKILVTIHDCICDVFFFLASQHKNLEDACLWTGLVYSTKGTILCWYLQDQKESTIWPILRTTVESLCMYSGNL